MIGVADGEGIGQGVMKRDIGAREMRHGERALVGHPTIVVPGVPGAMRGYPVVREIFKELQAEIRSRRVKGQKYKRRCHWVDTRPDCRKAE